MKIALGNIVIFTILILPIQDHDISCHLFVLFFISFMSILEFSACSSYFYLGMLILIYILLFLFHW